VQAVEIYEALASEDNMLALRNLAICFISGRGVRRNAKQGLLLFPLALWRGCLLRLEVLTHAPPPSHSHWSRISDVAASGCGRLRHGHL
jgi:hypothetical protein